MPEHLPSEKGDAALAFQALLYATGELDGPKAAQFETRLGEDQAARQALCHAVQLAHSPAALDALRPDPAYRDRVRQRVLNPQSGWRRLLRKRAYPGHPVAWAGLGAAAAVLIMVGISQGLHFGPAPAARVTEQPPGRIEDKAGPAQKPLALRPRPPKPSPVQQAAASSALEARVWAELQTHMQWRKRLLTTLSAKH